MIQSHVTFAIPGIQDVRLRNVLLRPARGSVIDLKSWTRVRGRHLGWEQLP